MNNLKIDSGALFYLIIAVIWIFTSLNSWRKKQSMKESVSKATITPKIDYKPEPFKPSEPPRASKIQNQIYREKTIEEQSFRVEEGPILEEEKDVHDLTNAAPDEKETVTNPLELIISNNSPLTAAIIFHEILSPPKSQR